MKPIAHKLIVSRHCVMVSLLHSHRCLHAQEKPLKKINWGVTSLSAGNWIPWIAKEAKIYDKHGLDVQLILLRGSGQTSAAMFGGSIFASPVTLTTMIMADLSGADFVNVAHTVAAVPPSCWSSRKSSEWKISTASASVSPAWVR